MILDKNHVAENAKAFALRMGLEWREPTAVQFQSTVRSFGRQFWTVLIKTGSDDSDYCLFVDDKTGKVSAASQTEKTDNSHSQGAEEQDQSR